MLASVLSVTGLVVAVPSAAHADPVLTFSNTSAGINVSYDSSCEAYGVTTGSYSPGWRALAFGNGGLSGAHGVFLALRSDGRVFRSLDDGSTWTESGMIKRTISSTNGSCIIRNGFLAYGEPSGVPTWVIALKNEKQIFTSTDNGATWSVPVGVSDEPLKLAYGGGRFLLGLNGGNNSRVSTDGTSWSAGGSLTNGGGYPGGSTYGNGQFVVPIGASRAVCASADGASFACASDALVNDGSSYFQWQDMTFGSGIYVGAVNNPALSTNGVQLQRSTDATTWQAPTSGLASRISGVTFGDGFFVAESFGNSPVGSWNGTGTTTSAYFSSDGLAWSSAGTGSAGRTFIAEYGNRIAFGDHHFVGVGNNGVVSVGVFANLPPGAPTGVTAVAGDAQATVSFAAPASDGGSAITGYTVTSVQDPTKACSPVSGTSCVVTGLTNGTSYTFTVRATNANGTGAASSASSGVTPAVALFAPGAPTSVTATAGDARATVSFTAPSSDGGSVITGYTVTSVEDPTKGCAPVTGTSCVVTGLANGTSYTFTVTATNAIGTGAASSASSGVIPTAPTLPSGPSTPADQGTPAVSAPSVSPTVSSETPSAAGSGQTIINNFITNNYTIQQMAPSQIAALTSEQISEIAAAVVALLTPSQIAALSPRAFSGLKRDQVRALRPIQVKAIKPNQIKALDPEALSTATKLTIASLSTNTALKLSPAQLEALTPQAVRGITRSVYRKMSRAQQQAIATASN